MATKVMIADDHTMFRAGLAAIISDMEGVEIVAEAENGAEALRLAQEHKPDILLLDINMPFLDGYEVMAEMEKLELPTKTIVVSMHDDDEHIVKALSAGAQGYLCKCAEPVEVKKAICEVANNQPYFNDRTNSAMLSSLMLKKNKDIAQVGHEKLSEKEIKILQLLADGLSNEEIAKTIFASTRTIENIRYGLMKKVGVSNGLGLIVYAIKNQLVKI